MFHRHGQRAPTRNIYKKKQAGDDQSQLHLREEETWQVVIVVTVVMVDESIFWSFLMCYVSLIVMISELVGFSW